MEKIICKKCGKLGTISIEKNYSKYCNALKLFDLVRKKHPNLKEYELLGQVRIELKEDSKLAKKYRYFRFRNIPKKSYASAQRIRNEVIRCVHYLGNGKIKRCYIGTVPVKTKLKPLGMGNY